MPDTFATWNKGKLQSYLIEITADILFQADTDGEPLVEKSWIVLAEKVPAYGQPWMRSNRLCP